MAPSEAHHSPGAEGIYRVLPGRALHWPMSNRKDTPWAKAGDCVDLRSPFFLEMVQATAQMHKLTPCPHAVPVLGEDRKPTGEVRELEPAATPAEIEAAHKQLMATMPQVYRRAADKYLADNPVPATAIADDPSLPSLDTKAADAAVKAPAASTAKDDPKPAAKGKGEEKLTPEAEEGLKKGASKAKVKGVAQTTLDGLSEDA